MWKSHYLPKSFIYTCTIPEDAISHSLRIHSYNIPPCISTQDKPHRYCLGTVLHSDSNETEGCDFNVLATYVGSRGSVLDCSVSREFESRISEITIAWLAYPPSRQDIYGEVVDIRPEDWMRSTITFPRHLRTQEGVSVFMALTRLSIEGQDFNILLSKMSVTPQDVEWQFSVSGASGLLSMACAAFVVVPRDNCKWHTLIEMA